MRSSDVSCLNEALSSKTNPTFSVVVPVYNAQLHIDQCVNSILAQGREDIEVVLVDDGSTDSSGAICDAYAAKHPSMEKVVHKENQGPLIARVEGFAVSKGRYIMSADADDAFLPGAFDAIAFAMRQTGADIVLWAYTTNERDLLLCQARDEPNYAEPKKASMLRSLCTTWNYNSMWRKAVKRECACLNADYSSYKGMMLSEDFLQTLAIYDSAKTFCEIEDPLYFYRPNPKSTTNAAYQNSYYKDIVNAMTVADTYAEKWENEYGCEGLLQGLAKKSLNSILNYAKYLAEKRDYEKLNTLSRSDFFKKRYALHGAMKGIRLDKRAELALLKSEHCRLFCLESAASRALKKILQVNSG